MYTYVGDIVVSVNPFKNTGCYGKAIRAKFKGGSRRLLPPHIYALVDHAYQEMMRNQMSQSILISGESGAGKTEAMKICLTFISEVSAAKGQRVSDEVRHRPPSLPAPARGGARPTASNRRLRPRASRRWPSG